MSKRYGRNQKRKARDLLEQERSLREYAETRVADIEAATDEIRRKWSYIVQLIVSTVEPTCLIRAMALDVKEVITCIPDARSMPWAEPLPQSMAWSSIQQAPAFEQMKVIDLHPLLTRISRDEFGGQRIAKLHYKDGTSYYALSDKALEKVPTQWLAERIASELIPLLKQAQS